MLDIMVDLETKGNRPGCAVLSIGAVAFDPVTGELDDGLYTVVSAKSCKRAKLHEDPSTMAWWSNQSEQAREVLAQADAKTAPTLAQALMDFNLYITSFGPAKQLKVWGNGSDFDNAILAVAYANADVKQPWDFWHNRCYRTFKSLAPDIKLDRTGTYHNALDDARSQAEHHCRIYAHLFGVA